MDPVDCGNCPGVSGGRRPKFGAMLSVCLSDCLSGCLSGWLAGPIGRSFGRAVRCSYGAVLAEILKGLSASVHLCRLLKVKLSVFYLLHSIVE